MAYTNQVTNVWQYAYDAAGGRTSETTPNNETSSFGYTAAGDLLTLQDAFPHTNLWVYSVQGLTTDKTMHGGVIVETNLFDANRRMTVRWTPAGGTQSYSSGAAGNNIQRTNPAVTNQFDALNRLPTGMVRLRGGEPGPLGRLEG